MRSIVCSFVLVFSSFICSDVYSQTRLSEVVSDGNSQKHILTTYDDVSYLLKIDSQDSLYVYRFDGEEAVHMHTSHFHTLYDTYWFEYVDSYLLIEHPEGGVVYDFVENTQYVIPFVDGETSVLWRSKSNGLAVLSHGSTYQLIDLKTGKDLEYEEAKRIRKITKDHLLLATQGQEHVKIDIYNQDAETTMSIVADGHRYFYAYDDHDVIYARDKKVYTYNYDSDETRYIMDLDVDTYRVYQSENFYVFTPFRNYDLETYLVDKSTLAKSILGFNVDGLDYQEYDGKLLIEPNSTDLRLFDPSTSEYHVLERAPQRKYLTVLGNRYIMYRSYPEDVLYDTYTGEYSVVDINHINDRLNDSQVQLGNKILFNIGDRNEEVHDLIQLDTETMECTEVSPIPFQNSGLRKRSILTNKGKDILVLNDKMLYAVQDDKLVQLSQGEILKNEHKSSIVVDDKLLWAEKEGHVTTFYSYKDGEKVKEASINETDNNPYYNIHITSFSMTKSKVYINGRKNFEAKLFSLDKESGRLDELSDINSYLLSALHICDGRIFFVKDQHLHVIEEDDSEVKIDVQLSAGSFAPIVIHDNVLYFSGMDGVYRLDGNNAILELELQTDPVIPFHILGTVLKVRSLDNEHFALIDGTWIKQEAWLGENVFQLTDRYLKVVDRNSSGEYYTRLYDLEEASYIDLPETINNKSVVNIFQNFDDTFLITTEGTIGAYKVEVYKMSDDYQTYTLVTDFPSSGRGVKANWVSYGNEGLLYAGSRLFLMDTTLNFVPLEGLAGDHESVNIVEENGAFYFLAFDSQYGRQLFKVLAFSERISTTTLIENLQVYPYPNPTQSSIKVDLEGNTRYTIFDVSGKEVLRGVLSNQDIDIRQLNNGLYLIVFESEGKVYRGSFVKAK